MAEFSLTTASELFKITYGKLSENTYNSANVLLGRVKKQYDFVGKRKDVAVPLSFQGGVGSGSLPVANAANYGEAQITAKKMYARVQIEREAIKSSVNDEGSFVRATKHVVEKGVESWMRNMTRALYNDGTGKLGVVTSVSGTGPSYTLTVDTASTFKEANYEEGDYINIETGNTDLFEITSVNAATRAVGVTRITGSQVPVGTDEIFMQGSEDNDPQGLKGVLDATSSTLYAINVGRRWQAAVQLAAAGAGITPDKLNQAMLDIQRKVGKVPNLIVQSFTQFRKTLNLLEDQKQYEIYPRDTDLQGKISFKGISYMSSAGPVPLFPERFVEDDRVYLLNDSFATIHHRPGFGWFDDDGTVFLRVADSDAYEARYGGYLEAYIPPTFHGVISGLAV